MASGAVLWFGEVMSAVPLRNNKAAAGAARSVTVLGATGSIGRNTVALLETQGGAAAYDVVAVTGAPPGNTAALPSGFNRFTTTPDTGA